MTAGGEGLQRVKLPGMRQHRTARDHRRMGACCMLHVRAAVMRHYQAAKWLQVCGFTPYNSMSAG